MVLSVGAGHKRDPAFDKSWKIWFYCGWAALIVLAAGLKASIWIAYLVGGLGAPVFLLLANGMSLTKTRDSFPL